ncbi:hypothetical protein [Bifidobacterium crudilactis]|nr:hypothetical protein [Bifidobacterium crudilactis]MDN6209645.1 hypothetical protein [Bifidobacterium crudilactis]MDN6466306.1 hypothetical protein [Bifidobacterium crudilactis]MDN6523478.1 hypothetical protein [Bifidobacterium crudilactis]MDN6654118.1 hypothetical protein [Bifidobacterium crudilactis]MDN6684119.1 hypothetical protein [Bifidobacterium crudilactis]
MFFRRMLHMIAVSLECEDCLFDEGASASVDAPDADKHAESSKDDATWGFVIPLSTPGGCSQPVIIRRRAVPTPEYPDIEESGGRV